MSVPNELRAYMDERLTAAFNARLHELGYWCPRCDCEALPIEDNGPGWCPICGLDPRTPGPAPEPAKPRGLLS